MQCKIRCIVSSFRLSRARIRTGKVDWIGQFGDLRTHWLMCLKYET